MRDSDLRTLIADSLAALHVECPAAHLRMCAAVGRRVARLIIDGEVITLHGTGNDCEVADECPADRAAVRVVASRRALLDLMDGRESLEEAVLGDRVEVWGAADDLLALHEGLRWYVLGGVRAPSFERLAEVFRGEEERYDGK